MKLPYAEAHIALRLGPSARGGADLFVLGAHPRAQRKSVRGGHRGVIARLPLSAHQSVLGVAPAAVAGQIVALDELWGRAAVRELEDRLFSTRSLGDAAAILEGAVLARAPRPIDARTRLVVAAAERLAQQRVGTVADELGVSERNLRRVFAQVVGMSPKAYARLSRFHRAHRAARASQTVDWAAIAIEQGYCDQAHMIAEFRQLTGVTPAALLREVPIDGA